MISILQHYGHGRRDSLVMYHPVDVDKCLDAGFPALASFPEGPAKSVSISAVKIQSGKK